MHTDALPVIIGLVEPYPFCSLTDFPATNVAAAFALAI